MEKIVVVGSLHYDIFVEAPHRPTKGETVTGIKWYPKFGGKGGNQALAVAKYGCNVTMVSAVGDDAFAKGILQVLEKHNIDTSYIQHIQNTKTGMSVAIKDDSDYEAVIVSGANLKIDNNIFSENTLWDNAKILVLQNEVLASTNIAAAKAAKQRGILVCINAAPAMKMEDELKDLIDILIVNELEARQFTNINIENLDDAKKACLDLSKYFKSVIVTAGDKGVACCLQGQEPWGLDVHKVKLISTHGAGDCFVGAFCSKFATTNNFRNAVDYANLMAAQHVSSDHNDVVIEG